MFLSQRAKLHVSQFRNPPLAVMQLEEALRC